MSMQSLIDLLSGALALAYLLASVFFLRFWQRTSDRLFVFFAAAFGLLMLNQVATAIPALTDETGGSEYLLRVLGFGLIIVAIVERNLRPRP
jgi:hypothetical protein